MTKNGWGLIASPVPIKPSSLSGPCSPFLWASSCFGGQCMDNYYMWAAAIAGVLARVGKWWRDDQSFHWQKALSEMLTIPAIGFVTGGVCQYISPTMDQAFVGLIACCIGLLGTAGLELIANKVLGNNKIGGV